MATPASRSNARRAAGGSSQGLSGRASAPVPPARWPRSKPWTGWATVGPGLTFAQWYKDNIPFLDTPDDKIDEVYYS